MAYQVNDWLTVGFYGQYVPTKTSDPRSVIMSPFNPKSSYGGFMEVMFNQHWGIGAKMGREFAPQKNGKWGWKNTTEVYPISEMSIEFIWKIFNKGKNEVAS